MLHLYVRYYIKYMKHKIYAKMGDFCYPFFLLPPQIRCSIQTHHHLKTQIITSIGRILSHNLRFNSLLHVLSTLLSESCIFSAQVVNKTSHDNCNLKAWILSPVSTVTFPPLDLKCQSHQKIELRPNAFGMCFCLSPSELPGNASP